MTNLTPDQILEIEAQARVLRAREIRRLAVAFGGLVRRMFGRGAQTRAA